MLTIEKDKFLPASDELCSVVLTSIFIAHNSPNQLSTTRKLVYLSIIPEMLSRRSFYRLRRLATAEAAAACQSID